MRKILWTVSFGMSAAFLANQAFAEDRVIYGNDNRKDVYEVTDELHLKLAKGTAMLVGSSSVRSFDSSNVTISGTTYGSSMSLCSTEKFYSQKNPGFCSGFLVGPDTFVTAGHCITSASACTTTSIVFDYNADANGLSPTSVPKSNVYTCKKIISRALSGDLDYAVVQLDRVVTDREPVAFRKSGKVEDGADLIMIGHPSGLPSKVEDGGSVRTNSNASYFVATTDSYGGNSGSAVFNAVTGEVEGILVRGETDFVYQGSCKVSKVCSETSCRGEDVSRASQFAKYVPVPTPVPTPAPAN